MLSIQATEKLIKHNCWINSDRNFITFSENPSVSLIEPYVLFKEGFYGIGEIGAYSYFNGGNTSVKNVSKIGRYCSIARDVSIGAVEHPTDYLSTHHTLMGSYYPDSLEIKKYVEKNSENINTAKKKYFSGIGRAKNTIGNDVWIGEGAFIRRGVKLSDGCIIGAKSVVTKDVGPYEIVAGQPARLIRKRFKDDIIKRLLELKWWEYDLNSLAPLNFSSIDKALDQIEKTILSKKLKPVIFPILEVHE